MLPPVLTGSDMITSGSPPFQAAGGQAQAQERQMVRRRGSASTCGRWHLEMGETRQAEELIATLPDDSPAQTLKRTQAEHWYQC
jgi:hypothetical protein